MKKENKILKEVVIYCDGSCKGNPGPGGWAAILIYRGKRKILTSFAKETTNNIMELTCAIKALEKLKEPCTVALYSDSTYLVKGMTEWMQKWKEKGWKNSKKKQIKNLELWQQLERLAQKHNIYWQWLKGHEGHPENEECDRLAKYQIKKHIK
ncbi:ribonuclease HI [bacterium]|nr:MAG: ribonuclease HI [bacterium]